MWSRFCQPLERMPPVSHQGRRTARLACVGSSSSGSPQAAPQGECWWRWRRQRRWPHQARCSRSSPCLPPPGLCADTPSSGSQAAWCRPLSGCATAFGPGGGAATQGDYAADVPSPQLPPIVALGKFDALHRGHRALAAAAAGLGGAPWMVSFSGMAEVLGWPARLPLVAPCDRARVLDSWASSCQGRAPRECAVPFAEVCCAPAEGLGSLGRAAFTIAPRLLPGGRREHARGVRLQAARCSAPPLPLFHASFQIELPAHTPNHVH